MLLPDVPELLLVSEALPELEPPLLVAAPLLLVPEVSELLVDPLGVVVLGVVVVPGVVVVEFVNDPLELLPAPWLVLC